MGQTVLIEGMGCRSPLLSCFTFLALGAANWWQTASVALAWRGCQTGDAAVTWRLRLSTQEHSNWSTEHSRGLDPASRDLKLENILLTAGGDVKLSDFGLGAVREAAAQRALLHTVGRSSILDCGTFYVSPDLRCVDSSYLAQVGVQQGLLHILDGREARPQHHQQQLLASGCQSAWPGEGPRP